MLRQLFNFRKKDSRYLSSDSFKNLTHQHPLVINNNPKSPIYLSRSDLRSGVIIDGARGHGVHTIGGIYLTQLISRGAGVVALINTTYDSEEMIMSAAQFYGRKEDLVIITEENIENVSKSDLFLMMKEKKIVLVYSNKRDLDEKHNSNLLFISFVLKLATAMPIASNDSTSPSTLLCSSSFFAPTEGENHFATINAAAIENNWARILVDTDEKFFRKGHNETYSYQLCMSSKGERNFPQHRSDLTVGEFVLAVDGIVSDPTPHFARFVTVPEVNYPVVSTDEKSA